MKRDSATIAGNAEKSKFVCIVCIQVVIGRILEFTENAKADYELKADYVVLT